jgi:hypothetical protein
MSEPTKNNTSTGTKPSAHTVALITQPGGASTQTETPVIVNEPLPQASAGADEIGASFNRLVVSVERLEASIKEQEAHVDRLIKAFYHGPRHIANSFGQAMKDSMKESTEVSRVRAIDDEAFDRRLVNLDVAPVNRYFGSP